MIRTILLSVVVGVALVQSKEKYMKHIPNSFNVKNPCDQSKWIAIGHTDATEGKDGENPFGEDFKHVGDKHWNKALCEKDSDGDGKSNGAELGDPSCIWSEHGSHNLQAVTGHPGICEPVGSPACSHQQFDCQNLFGSHHHHG
ncbi:hypothetical protein LOTGIDRAFT_235155 [Lottia gigantea]|uniref:Temptin Cys/Cys disulfide domain-containing protein n=1 Tax=Lottia gigantea TaxID=225164 RepID=V3ZRJ5_LOTGI|nr:hypothetical protein LOTGIDRAFT_235155 [Lottia gigantea]ESO86957.1 hypothetical protein LOTGIDRAFT_235155 [Lottia gigantea]